MDSTTKPVLHQIDKGLPQFPVGLRPYHHYLKPAFTLPAAPQELDRYKQVSRWPLDGNVRHGDCTMAAAAHSIHLWNVTTHQSNPIPNTQQVIDQYLKLSKGSEAGLIESNVLKTWHSRGLWGHKILGYSHINVHNIAMIKQAVFMYGLAYVGVQLTHSSDRQFKDRTPWALAPGWQSEVPYGAHAIPIVGYDKHHFYVVTWGVVLPVSFDWWHVYGEEAWVILPPQLKEAGGCDHLDLDQLQADLRLV